VDVFLPVIRHDLDIGVGFRVQASIAEGGKIVQRSMLNYQHMQQGVPKLWIFFFLIVLGLIIAILTTQPSSSPSIQTSSDAPEATRYATFEQMLELGDNAVYVENQASGSTFVLIGFAVLSQPGFVVIFNDDGGVPGSAVGESNLLPTGGEHLIVPVNEALVDGQVYYAMLYHDDGNGRFREDQDTQVVDSEQSVILMSFLASDESEPESGPVEP